MITSLAPVAILAGGLATRMGTLTQRTPKALLDVAGEPFIVHQLRLLAGQGVHEVVLCVGHLGELIEQEIGNGAAFGLCVRYCYDGPALLGTAGALKRALPLLGKRFFVMYGDSYLPCAFAPIQRAFEQANKPALMTVFRNEGRWDKSNVHFADGKIMSYDKLVTTPLMNHIDYGLGILTPRAFRDVADSRPADLAEVYRGLLARGQLAAFEVHERFFEIGSFAGLEETCQYLRATATIKRPA